MCVNVQEGGGGVGVDGWVWQIDRTILEEKVQNLKEKIRKYETKHCFTVSRNNSKQFFSYFCIFSVSKNDRNSATQ